MTVLFKEGDNRFRIGGFSDFMRINIDQIKIKFDTININRWEQVKNHNQSIPPKSFDPHP